MGTLTFTIGGVDYDLPADHWWLTVSQFGGNKDYCVTMMEPMDCGTGEYEGLFIVGDTFMQLFYTVFNREHNTVGFATAVHS